MRLPGGDDVEIDPRKLIDYALSPSHPWGKDKARVFRSALAMTADDAPALLVALREAAATSDEVVLGHADEHGQRYRLRFNFSFRSRSAMINSGWLVPADGGKTRLVSVYVGPRNA